MPARSPSAITVPSPSGKRLLFSVPSPLPGASTAADESEPVKHEPVQSLPAAVVWMGRQASPSSAHFTRPYQPSTHVGRADSKQEAQKGSTPAPLLFVILVTLGLALVGELARGAAGFVREAALASTDRNAVAAAPPPPPRPLPLFRLGCRTPVYLRLQH